MPLSAPARCGQSEGDESAPEHVQMEEAEAPGGPCPEEDAVLLNVGGWPFALPRSKVAQFPDSLLWKEVSAPVPAGGGRQQQQQQGEDEEQDDGEEEEEEEEEPGAAAGRRRLFLDRDGAAFRHVHAFLHTARLSLGSCAELHLLDELARRLRLGPLLQTLDSLKEGKHHLRIRPADIPVAERASVNYWRTRKCISKPSECPPKSPALTGFHEKAPLGLMDTPLLDTEEEVHYCFLPLGLVEKYPSLVGEDNLLWLSDKAVLLESESSEFRFVANFLRSEKILLPDNFSRVDVLEAEAEALGIPELTEAVKRCKAGLGVYSEETSDLQGSVKSTAEKPLGTQGTASLPLPLYPMVLGLLVKYPDSALGQLHMESTLDGNKLYISGNGVLFQHVMNWLGTCRLPLIRNASELPELCAYLDQMDVTYEPMKDALRVYLKQRTSTDTRGKDAGWAADVAIFSPLHIVKVYVGSHWYATYLQTLLKFPELLSNCKKAIWIAYGQSLLIHGDGQMFRHVLNFLRLGKLFLPSEFKEWSLLCQEVAEFQIPSLVEALRQYDTYRSWVQQQEAQREALQFGSLEITGSEKERESGEGPGKLSHTAVASKGTIMGDAPVAGGNERETCISPTEGAKRRNTWEGSGQPTEGGPHPCGHRQPESPPRKRGAKGNGAKKPENRDTPIQKLISLVQGWDMVNCRCWEAQQPPASSGLRAEEEPKSRVSSNPALGVTDPGPCRNGLVPTAHDRLPKAGQHVLGAPPAERRLVKAGRATGRDVAGEEPSGQKEREKGTFPEQASGAISREPRGHAGLILKVEHPPVVAGDGSCVAHEGSVLYSTCPEGLKRANALAGPATPEIVFLRFPLSQEEIFYARQCHGFLTDVILDSIRQKDPKGTTARIQLLVQRLWSLQITAREFVADLLNMAPFKGSSYACEKLLKWVEFSLPFAWKYSSCIELLVKKGYFKSLSRFAIEKYLQKPE